MRGITVFEFDVLAPDCAGSHSDAKLHSVPNTVYEWLEKQCLLTSEAGQAPWLRLAQCRGSRVVQVTSYVGVIRAPDGFQIEVLPKVGKAESARIPETRQRLIDMLRCLHGFRHIETDRAKVLAARMPLLEVFVAEFLRLVRTLIRRGLRSAYALRQDNLFALRGKLLMAAHLRQNLTRADRFFTEHDEFTANRPANRLLHAALRQVLQLTVSWRNQQLARELAFVFADIPVSRQPYADFQRVRLDRSMGHYADALAWARLLLNSASPLTGAGEYRGPSLLFPMAAVFEAFVAHHLGKQLAPGLKLYTQAGSRFLVQHQGQNWFQLKPDLLIQASGHNIAVLDTKWKMLDARNGTNKYGLSQSDFYQLLAYGQNYLNGTGDLALVYPKSPAFGQPLPVFEYHKANALRLWALPFCLETRRLLIPADGLQFMPQLGAHC